MSIIGTLQSSYGMGAYAPPIRSIHQLHSDEQPFTMHERHGKAATYATSEVQAKESTDTTGIKISEETKAFLQQLEQEKAQESSQKNGQSAQLYQIVIKKATTPQINPKANPFTNEDEEDLAYGELTEEEEEIVEELEERDAEVRAHEQAHMAAGAGLTSGPSYEYEIGPDGKQYAVGGSVQIDTSSSSTDPDATLAKADKIRAAAMAPGSPSSQDYAVANAASQMKAEANKQKSEETESTFANKLADSYGNKVGNANNVSQISAQNVSNEDSSALPNSSALLSAVGMYAQYNRPLESQAYASQAQAMSNLENLQNTQSASSVLMPSAVSANEKIMSSDAFNKNANRHTQNEAQYLNKEQYKQQAINAYSQVQAFA